MDEVSRESCVRYVAELFAAEDDVLRDLRATIAEEGFPEIYVSPEEGRLLQVVLRAAGAARIVEIGTLGGYSAIWMARALPEDGVLITLELVEERAELARRFVKRAGLADRVEVRVGDARDLLKGLEGPFDAVFIDADKASYPEYLDWSLAHVPRGGLVIADNSFMGGAVVDPGRDDPDVRGMREYNRRIATDPRLSSIVVPVRDGVAISVVEEG